MRDAHVNINAFKSIIFFYILYTYFYEYFKNKNDDSDVKKHNFTFKIFKYSVSSHIYTFIFYYCININRLKEEFKIYHVIQPITLIGEQLKHV